MEKPNQSTQEEISIPSLPALQCSEPKWTFIYDSNLDCEQHYSEAGSFIIGLEFIALDQLDRGDVEDIDTGNCDDNGNLTFHSIMDFRTLKEPH